MKIGEGLGNEKKNGKCICKEFDLIWGSKVNCTFRKKVVQICAELWGEENKLKMANGLMAVMGGETGGYFIAHMIEGVYTPKEKSKITLDDFIKEVNDLDKEGKLQYNDDGSIKKRKESKAVGLIQFTLAPLKALGYYKGGGLTELNKIKHQFSQMTELEQLDVVKKYFEHNNAYRKILVPEDLYTHTFAPAFVGKDLDDVMYARGTTYYERNKNLDIKYGNNDGNIQKKEIIDSYFKNFDKGLNEKFESACEIYEEEKGMSAEGWHDPVINLQINRYEYYGSHSPKSACFGYTRKNGKRFHHGLDIFAILKTTKIYASLDSKFISAGGSTITLEIINTKELINQMNLVKYKIQYANFNEYLAAVKKTSKNGDPQGEEKEFILRETDTIHFRYLHLNSWLDKKQIINKDGIIKAGTHFAFAGVKGGAGGTHAPHLHLEILNITAGKGFILNPALFINLNSFINKEQDEANKKW